MRSYYIGMARGVVVIERHSAVGAALPLDPSVHTPDAPPADDRTDVLYRAGPRAAESAIERREG